MPSFKPKTLWAAEPHTLAKLELIRRYLSAWFQILGRGNGKRLVYIDGFAGPGEYLNHRSGSPIVALREAVRALSSAGNALGGKELLFYFIEKETWIADHLREKLNAWKLSKEIRWEVREGSFHTEIDSILAAARRGCDNVPLFAFIDPFGATGVPFTTVAEILALPTSEVLLNLDSDGIARLMGADATGKNKQHLDDLFGDTKWRNEIGNGTSLQDVCSKVLRAYKMRLHSLKEVRYSFAFTMNDQPGRLNYHLVFASQHPLGLKKMKEAMKGIDQAGNYSFSDSSVDEQPLRIDFNESATFALRLHSKFSGSTIPFGQVEEFALNETPFTSPSGMLTKLRKDGLIAPEFFGEPPRQGFPPEKVRAIRFLSRQPAVPTQGKLFDF